MAVCIACNLPCRRCHARHSRPWSRWPEQPSPFRVLPLGYRTAHHVSITTSSDTKWSRKKTTHESVNLHAMFRPHAWPRAYSANPHEGHSDMPRRRICTKSPMQDLCSAKQPRKSALRRGTMPSVQGMRVSAWSTGCCPKGPTQERRTWTQDMCGHTLAGLEKAGLTWACGNLVVGFQCLQKMVLAGNYWGDSTPDGNARTIMYVCKAAVQCTGKQLGAETRRQDACPRGRSAARRVVENGFHWPCPERASHSTTSAAQSPTLGGSSTSTGLRATFPQAQA